MTDKKKILVVDDEADMVTWLEAFFQDNGFCTTSASNGTEGVEKAISEKPDLITLDISMDKESGVKALRRLQDIPETSLIPIVIITGVSGDLRRFIDHNKRLKFPAAFLEKPVDREELLATVTRLIGQ
jgi:CheY-like chemotaxis protein